MGIFKILVKRIAFAQYFLVLYFCNSKNGAAKGATPPRSVGETKKTYTNSTFSILSIILLNAAKPFGELNISVSTYSLMSNRASFKAVNSVLVSLSVTVLGAVLVMSVHD